MAETTTSKYEEERGVLTRLDQLRADKEAQALKDGNYINLLDNEYDKVKADTNNDGKVDAAEYKSYIVKKAELEPTILKSNITQDNNNNVNHNYYHFDSTSLIAICIICLTVIICTIVKHKK